MKNYLKSKLSQRTIQNIKAIYFDYKRFKIRMFQKRKKTKPKCENLQLGAGVRRVKGWLNVDLFGSDQNLDLSYGKLPWLENSFQNILAQHFIEHLHLKDELIPLFAEMHRVIKPGGCVWLSCPDIEKICKSYIENKCQDLVDDRKKRMPEWSLKDYPSQHMINDLFHQNGEHKNLFDFDLLKWTLKKSGFDETQKISEKDLLIEFKDFPIRNDDKHTLYVKAIAYKRN